MVESYWGYQARIRREDQERRDRARARTDARAELELLRMVQAGRIEVADDPDNAGCIIFKYGEADDTYYDGSDVTDEMMDAHRFDFVRFGAGHMPVLTPDGAAYLEEELDTDLGREYLADLDQRAQASA